MTHPTTRRLLPLLALSSALSACKKDPAGPALPAGQAPLRRLTPTEYNNTVRDLYGHRTALDWYTARELDDFELDELYEASGGPRWPQTLPPEIPVHGFEGFREGQVASPYLVERYQAVARTFGALVTEAPHFWTCAPEGLGDAALSDCARDSVVKLASRAYRRDLSDDERAALLAFHDANVAEQGVMDGVRLTTTGVLSSPQFLYVAEPDDGVTEHWALANRLSYFLYDSMPDPELFAAASQGELGTEAEVEAQVRRMLGDWRAREAVVHFHSQWLDLDGVYATRPDFETYMPIYLPELMDEREEDEQSFEELWSAALIGLRVGMVREAERFVEDTVFERDGTLGDLLTDHRGYVTEIAEYDLSTADLYGVDDGDIGSGGVERLEFDDGNLGFEIAVRPANLPASQRSGVLTQGAVLTTLAHPVHPAPVLRGVFVLERLTCTELGQPPDDAEASAPPDSPDADATNRVRVEAATADPVCSGCHDRINPTGFAFEHYDSVGGWRDTDNGAPVDASGSLYLAGEGQLTFRDAVELGQGLAGSRLVHDCYALHWTRYAMGRELTADDQASLTAIQDAFWASGGQVSELLVSIATSPLFRTQTPDAGGR